jgi:hypothetical protein
MLASPGRDLACMVREIDDDRLDHAREVGVFHADRIGVRSGLKHNCMIFREESIHVDRKLVEVAERRHRADLTIRERRRNLLLARQIDML